HARFSPRQGREALLHGWTKEFAALRGCAWIGVPEGEDAAALARELRVLASLEGIHVQGELPPRGGTQAEVETWLARAFARGLEALGDSGAGKRLFLLSIEGRDPSQRRAVESLARGLVAGDALVLVSSDKPPAAELEWREFLLPLVTLGTVEEFVAAWLVSETPAARTALSLALFEAGRARAAGIDRALERAWTSGLVLPSGRLRPGSEPSSSELGDPGQVELSQLAPAERALVQRLALTRGRASAAQCLAALDQDSLALWRALQTLQAQGLCGITSIGGVPQVELRFRADPERFALAERRATAARIADEFAAREEAAQDPTSALGLFHCAWDYVAGRSSARDFVRALADARDAGSPEAAIACAEESRWALGMAFESPPLAELALAYAQAGELDHALELARPLELSAAASDQAAGERIHGRVALARHEPGPALAHFERAALLDQEDGGEALLARVQLHAQLGRDEEVLAFADQLPTGRVEPRIAHAIEAYAAMSWLRRGEIDRARTMLETQLEDARAAKDRLREAALCMNLGTLERRAGLLDRALGYFETADAQASALCSATQCAQVRGAFAALLRDLGELRRAEELALSAVALRQRLGDHAGSHVTRGVLALIQAERGHVARAATESDLAAESLGRTGRRQDAALLEATASECRARLGLARGASSASEWERAKEGDPRLLLSLARSHGYGGDLPGALDLARRAEALAASLGLEPVRIQARDWLVHAENPRASPRATLASDTPLARLDLDLQRLLSSEPFDLAGARLVAAELERRGRDDRQARVWIAIAARASGLDLRRQAAERATQAVARCLLGAREGTDVAFRRNLLAVPDPWPEDHVLARAAASEQQENEMDVLRLLDINHRLLEQPNLNSLLGEIVDCALAVSGAERGFLILEKDGELEFDTALDSRRGDIPAPEVEVSRTILSEALSNMRPLRVSNAADDPAHAGAASVIALELRSVLCAPFRIDKTARGVIYVDHRLKSGAFTERAERMLTLLADQAALAIVQVHRLDEIRRLNRRLNQKVADTESELRHSQRALALAGLPIASNGLIGHSSAMREIHRLIELASKTRLSVLLLGPSGSGKELAARALHAQSARAEDPFVAENCAALPQALVESELFGSRRGAFTGAERDRAGLFERADHGTLFLDEIGELPLELQAKLLRVLETGEVRRLGGGDVVHVDFRLVTATNRDLAREVREGRFRADLFYRLEGLRIELPSLAQRIEDIPELVDHFLRLLAELGAAVRRVSKPVMKALCARPWPGNVRELRNEIERLCLLSTGDLDDPALVSQPDLALSPHAPDQLVTLADLERDAILRALRTANGDKNEAARMLGISRAKIYQRLKEWGVG
ncbi:MAG TPA: sigma 54-interacting transcriptional regulator, partial [Planctomycetota bacterium]|nr:sigma 54-interacting transcriptional regulator [Planctomycetota bacterium]